MNRAYRALLGIAPRALRAEHGDEMEELFAERLAMARDREAVAIAVSERKEDVEPVRLERGVGGHRRV